MYSCGTYQALHIPEWKLLFQVLKKIIIAAITHIFQIINMIPIVSVNGLMLVVISWSPGFKGGRNGSKGLWTMSCSGFLSQQSMVWLSRGKLDTKSLQFPLPQKWPGQDWEIILQNFGNAVTNICFRELEEKHYKPSLQSELLSQSPSPWPHGV